MLTKVSWSLQPPAGGTHSYRHHATRSKSTATSCCSAGLLMKFSSSLGTRSEAGLGSGCCTRVDVDTEIGLGRGQGSILHGELKPVHSRV